MSSFDDLETVETASRRRLLINTYCVRSRRGIRSFRKWEMFKAFFPSLFLLDTISKSFLKSCFAREKYEEFFVNNSLGAYLHNIISLSRKFMGESFDEKQSGNVDRIRNEFNDNPVFRYSYHFLISATSGIGKADRHMIKENLTRLSQKSAFSSYDLDVNNPELVEVLKIAYKIILMYERLIEDEEMWTSIFSSIRFVQNKINPSKSKDLEMELLAYKTALVGIMTYKKDLYPIMLKYAGIFPGEYVDENTIHKLKDDAICKVIHLNQATDMVMTSRQFVEKEAQMAKDIESSRNTIVPIDTLHERMRVIEMKYSESRISEITSFPFMLPYFYKNIIEKRKDLRIEKDEFHLISREDPVQIVICLWAIMFYDFVLLFEIEQGEKEEYFSELAKIKNRLQGFSLTIKRYLLLLVELRKDESSPDRRKQREEEVLKLRREFILTDRAYIGDSLFLMVKDLLSFLDLINQSKVPFFVVSEKDGSKLGPEKFDKLSNLEGLLESMVNLLISKDSFLVKKANKISHPTSEDMFLADAYLSE